MAIYRDESGNYLRSTDLGCYPIIHICDDGGILCADCCNDPRNPVHTDEPNDGWRIVASDVFYEGPPEHCAHCNREIESAYGDPESST